MVKTRRGIILLLLICTLPMPVIFGCRKPPTAIINQALAATNATFIGVNTDGEIPLSQGQLQTLKQIVSLFPKNSESLPEDLIAGDGVFKLNGVGFEWVGDALRIKRNGGDGYFVVRSGALMQMQKEFTNITYSAGKISLPSHEDWLKILHALDQSNPLH